jgi:hypothetical protein
MKESREWTTARQVITLRNKERKESRNRGFVAESGGTDYSCVLGEAAIGDQINGRWLAGQSV